MAGQGRGGKRGGKPPQTQAGKAAVGDAAAPGLLGLAPADSARAGAAALVALVTAEGRLFSEVLAETLAPLSPSDRARAQRLALETLRQLPRADRLLKPFLRRPPPEPALAVLRMATVEMLALGAPAHGAVGGAVSALRSLSRGNGPTGLVNAVLRRLTEAHLPEEPPADEPPPQEAMPEDGVQDGAQDQTDSQNAAASAWAALPVPELPGWLRGRLMSAWGKPATQAIEAAHLAGAPLDLTLRAGPAEAALWAERLGGVALATGSVRLAGPMAAVSARPGYAEGAWWVQDAAAALPVRLLAPRPGEAIADLCAAPGGKTLQLAAAGARVWALDISANRLTRLAENLARTGLAAEMIEADALTWQPPVALDAVLLDAPCSATGTIRRHPDLPHVKRPEALRELVALQARMIDHAADLLAPGGRLVFCTCSLLPEEGEAQLAQALARRPDLRPDPAALDRAEAEGWCDPAWRQPGGAALRLRPDFWPALGGMDGFFIACLRKAG